MRRIAIGKSARSQRFASASARYWGTQYNDLPEYGSDPDLTLRAQRPAVVVRWTKATVNQVGAYLFGAAHLPTFRVAPDSAASELDPLADGPAIDEARLSDLNARLSDLRARTRLETQLSELGRYGLLHGTVALIGHALEDRVWSEVVPVADAFPTFGADDRARAVELGLEDDDLLALDEYWISHNTTPEGEKYQLHRRQLTTDQTIEYLPVELDSATAEVDLAAQEWQVDTARTVEHNLGFIPAVWIPNLPIAGDQDGAPLVGEAEWFIEDEINYTLTQLGRAIRYKSEPLTVFVDVSNVRASNDDGDRVALRGGASKSLNLQSNTGASGRVELLEMEGGGQEAGQAYLTALRRAWQDVTRVVEHDPDKAVGALSGVALERLMAPMVALVGDLRLSYGRYIARWLELMLRVDGADVGPGTGVRVAVSWPPVIPMTPTDLQALGQTVASLWQQGVITLRTAVELLSPWTGADDASAYLEELAAEAGAGGTSGPL